MAHSKNMNMITIQKDVSNICSIIPAIAIPEYLESQGDDYGYFVLDNTMVLPFILQIRLGVRTVILSSPIINSRSVEDETNFINQLVVFIKEKRYCDILKCSNAAIFDHAPKDSIYCRFGTYIVDLSLTEEELFKKVHSKHRNVIRKAEKDGIIIEESANFFHDCVSLIQSTLARQNMIVPEQSSYHYLLSLGKYAEYWIAKDCEGNLQGCAILLWTPNSNCYYLYGGSAHCAHNGAMSLLMWRAMLSMKERGVNFFDFFGARVRPLPGSKQEGIQRFKSRFGATMRTGYIFKIPINPVKYYFLNLSLKIYSFLKYRRQYPGDMIDQEIKNKKYFSKSDENFHNA